MRYVVAVLALVALLVAAHTAHAYGFHHRGHGHHHGHGWWGWGGPAIVGGVIVGGALTAAAIAERRATADDMRLCARAYPTFDPATGTYTDAAGIAHICPYLR